MLAYSGHKVQTGTYWNMANGQRIDITEESILPDSNGAAYIKMPAVALLAVGPVLGLLFAAFLPFIGIAMTLSLIGKKLVSGLVNLSVKSSSFGWQPIEAYLDGKQRKQKDVKGTRKDDKM
jgi:hypothetical protein